MPDLPDSSSGSGSDSLSDLFRSLPDPSRSVPETPSASAPAPGSRRAARAAAQTSEPVSDAGAPDDMTTRVNAPASAEQESEHHATLDDLFRHEPETRARAPRRKRKRGCLIALIIVFVLVAGAALGGLWVMNTYGDRISEAMGWGEPKDYEAGMATGEALVTIDEGDTGQQVSTALYNAGVTKTQDVFYDMLVKEGTSPTFYPGVYRLQQKMTATSALEALNDPANKMENSALIREGLTLDSTLKTIAESLSIPIEDLTAAAADPSAYGVSASTLEGWLFPALYEFAPEATATDIVQTLVDRTRESLASAGVPAGDEERVLTIASIIQREARAEDDFYKVSRVIQNRLAEGMMLQMDSTAQYGYRELHDGTASTSDEAQHDDNPWNTYVHEGLPATPISGAGDVAIDAAMHPVDGPWLYFVTVNMDTGETVFTSTYEEHQTYVEQMRQWCTENPDSGC
ncbi:hypothetical protein GCM10025768_17930 [Microbacterium pseudoresistens]|uniref:Endolytic murein transglycosylase n=1 Tax=Microbacterium pseudoresistens TaxID=640634 RepID=A0A7Y9EX66_9MICO|nr:endolytic transglycosylase MltG [Microbacterium pseudoresistens]NYD55486.1 UPF0755 protein [Microbacterium pseudoresistens]